MRLFRHGSALVGFSRLGFFRYCECRNWLAKQVAKCRAGILKFVTKAERALFVLFQGKLERGFLPPQRVQLGERVLLGLQLFLQGF